MLRLFDGLLRLSDGLLSMTDIENMFWIYTNIKNVIILQGSC